MSCSVIVDNWSLQHIVELLTSGLSGDDAHVIRVSSDGHRYEPLSEGVIQTEALFDLLTEIVLRDEITVDSAFTGTWDGSENPLRELGAAGILRRVPFLDLESRFSDLRENMVERLCITESLKLEHAENVEGWNSKRITPNQLLSEVLWGGAGMAARSSAFQSSYCPHPLRRRFFLLAGLFLDGSSSNTKLNCVINEKRLLLAQKISAGDQLYSLHVTLPPIPIRIIEESSGPSDFVKVAMQLRPDFQVVREWLKLTEEAIVRDDLKTVRKQYKLLDDIAVHVDQKLGNRNDSTTLSAGIGFLKIATKANPIRSARNQFGVRSTINRLIYHSSGRSALNRYCKLFGETGTATERLLQEHFSWRK